MACENEVPDREIWIDEFPTARAAVEHDRATGGEAILLGRRNLVVAEADAEWLKASGTAFAFLYEVEGRVVTVPVNG
jgi:hypothetical protein